MSNNGVIYLFFIYLFIYFLLSAQGQMKYHFLSRLYSFSLNRDLLELQICFFFFFYSYISVVGWRNIYSRSRTEKIIQIILIFAAICIDKTEFDWRILANR